MPDQLNAIERNRMIAIRLSNAIETQSNRPLGDRTTILIDVPSTGFFFCLLQRNSVVTIEIDGKKTRGVNGIVCTPP